MDSVDKYVFVFLYFLGKFLSALFILGTIIVLTVVMGHFMRTVDEVFGLAVAMSVVSWIGWISYVGHQQMRFSWNKILLRAMEESVAPTPKE